ncbi:jg3968 [Pararge aegeria aegeria]|uniref:Jg3968 protein n=1 Tax=Pararge aegeria aegeria TaxID=348720 RepID=A0A8S4RZ05_9NEOP|nr:jg3968 [Pararge aegeria aegeria]
MARVLTINPASQCPQKAAGTRTLPAHQGCTPFSHDHVEKSVCASADIPDEGKNGGSPISILNALLHYCSSNGKQQDNTTSKPKNLSVAESTPAYCFSRRSIRPWRVYSRPRVNSSLPAAANHRPLSASQSVPTCAMGKDLEIAGK